MALFGLLRAGAIPVMCLPGHRLAELSHFADVSQAVALIITDTAGGFDYRAMADELVRTHPMRIITELPEAAELPSVQVDPGSPALLLVSGGTTGAPKLIPRTHDDYVYNVTASAELCGLTANDVYLVALPAAHNFPLACPGLLGAMSVGATTVFTTDPSPESAFATIARHGVTVTALAKLWAQACEWEPQRPTTLRLLQVGGAKLGADDARTVRAALTPGLQQVFGMAEGLLNYTRPGDPPEIVDNTQGAPLSAHDELRVVDDAGDEVAPGEEGELLVRGPYTLNGYFNAPRDDERSFSPDGFYRTGDRIRRFRQWVRRSDGPGEGRDPAGRRDGVRAGPRGAPADAHIDLGGGSRTPAGRLPGRKDLRRCGFHRFTGVAGGTERLPRQAGCGRARPPGRADPDVEPAHHRGREG